MASAMLAEQENTSGAGPACFSLTAGRRRQRRGPTPPNFAATCANRKRSLTENAGREDRHRSSFAEADRQGAALGFAREGACDRNVSSQTMPKISFGCFGKLKLQSSASVCKTSGRGESRAWYLSASRTKLVDIDTCLFFGLFLSSRSACVFLLVTSACAGFPPCRHACRCVWLWGPSPISHNHRFQ